MILTNLDGIENYGKSKKNCYFWNTTFIMEMPLMQTVLFPEILAITSKCPDKASVTATLLYHNH